MKLKIVFFIFLLLPGFALKAQQGKIWDLQSCINYALENNIQVKQSDLNRIQSAVALKGAKMSRLPSLNASTNYNLSTGRSINPFSNVIENDDIQSQRYNLNSSVTLFNYSAINNTIKRGVVDLEVSEYNLENTKNQTTLSIITFFTNVLLNEEQMKNARFNLETTQVRLDQVEKQAAAGAVNRQELLQARQQLALDEFNLINSENAFELAKLSLQQAMQLPVTSNFEIQVPELSDPEVNVLLEKPSTIYQTALAEQPDIKSAEANVKSARLGVKISEAGLYPSISLSAGLATSYSSIAPPSIPKDGTDNVTIAVPVGVVPSTGETVLASQEVPAEFDDLTYVRQLDFNQNSFIGLNLNIPIFNGLSARNNLQNARINQQRAELNAENAKNQLRQNIEQAYLDAIAAGKSYQSSKKQVEALTESLKNADQRNALGAITPIEYNQIRNDYNRAKTDEIRNKYDYIFKLKILDFYQGKNLSF